MASDISVGAQYVGPYEVKDAGDGKGQGAFATRDIRAGETILVDFTPIICKDTRNREDYLETVISLYSSVDESEKKAWNDLYEYYNTPRAQEYRTYYSQRQKEGKKFTPAQVSLYTHLALILNCNTYATSRNEMGLFIHASRFNHSCDPNVWYQSETKRGRWVGRAMRDVVKGEELTVSYLSNHAARAVRQNSCQTNWGFTCECPKCNDEPDTYAAALERALAEAEGRAPDTQKPPPSRGDSLEDREREVMTRIKLLRGIVNAVGDDDPASSKARMKEFVMVLSDGSIFHRECTSLFKKTPRNADLVKMRRHAQLDEDCSVEALETARQVWPEKHEMVQCSLKEFKTANRFLCQVFEAMDQAMTGV